MSLNVYKFADRRPMWFIMVHHGSSFCGLRSSMSDLPCPFHCRFPRHFGWQLWKIRGCGPPWATSSAQGLAELSRAQARGRGAKGLAKLLRSSGMATDLAEEQRGVAQRCGTEAAEDWGLTPHDTTRHDTTWPMTCVPKVPSKSSNSYVSLTQAVLPRDDALKSWNRSLRSKLYGDVCPFDSEYIPIRACLMRTRRTRRTHRTRRTQQSRRRTVRPHHPLPSGNPRVSRMFGPWIWNEHGTFGTFFGRFSDVFRVVSCPFVEAFWEGLEEKSQRAWQFWEKVEFLAPGFVNIQVNI